MGIHETVLMVGVGIMMLAAGIFYIIHKDDADDAEYEEEIKFKDWD